MKKLRATSEEREAFLKAIRDELYIGNYGTQLSNFSIDEIKKEFSEVPKDIETPIIQITTGAYIRMMELVNQSDTECSWHGLVKHFPEENRYIIYDILVYPQINSATTTTTDEDDFAEWQTRLIMDPNFPIENLRFHGHSHVNMSVFSSGVDDQYQKDLVTKVEDGDYYIFFIVNKKMEICMFLYDFDKQILFETKDISFSIVSMMVVNDRWIPTEDFRQWAIDELEQNAKTAPRAQYNKNYTTQRVSFITDEDEYESVCDYFKNAKPIFKGVNNGSK